MTILEIPSCLQPQEFNQTAGFGALCRCQFDL
jgi:hypothetical protein